MPDMTFEAAPAQTLIFILMLPLKLMPGESGPRRPAPPPRPFEPWGRGRPSDRSSGARAPLRREPKQLGNYDIRVLVTWSEARPQGASGGVERSGVIM